MLKFQSDRCITDQHKIVHYMKKKYVTLVELPMLCSHKEEK